jgi:hypothetical protein
MWDFVWNFSNPFDRSRQLCPNDTYDFWLPPIPENLVFQGKYDLLRAKREKEKVE